MIRVPDWAFEAAGQEARGMGQEAAYQPGLYLTTAQVDLPVLLIRMLLIVHDFKHFAVSSLMIMSFTSFGR